MSRLPAENIQCFFMSVYINLGGEGWLGFPDLWSGQNPDGTDI